MAMKQETMPSFFKVLISDDYTRKLRVPIAFVNKHGKMLWKSWKLITSSGETWVVKLEVDDEDERFCFTRGWHKFVQDLELGFGEILVFRCSNVVKYEFLVSVYGIDGCERKFPTKNLRIMKEVVDVDDDDDDDELINQQKGFSEVVNHQSRADYGHTSQKDHPHGPHFTLRLKKHHRSRLTLRKDFAKAAGLLTENSVVLQYPPKKRCWPVSLDHRQYRLDFCGGWGEFRRRNQLVLGKSYLFEYIEDKKVIQVKLITNGEESSS